MIRPLTRVHDQDVKRAVVGNSAAIGIGYAIQPGATGHNKFVVAAATSGLVLGVIVAIEKAGKISELNTVTVGSDNETTGLYSVVYIPSYIPVEYECDLSQAAGTTTNSGGLCFLNLASGAATLDETSVALFGGTAGQFVSSGVTDYSTTKVKAHIYKVF